MYAYEHWFISKQNGTFGYNHMLTYTDKYRRRTQHQSAFSGEHSMLDITLWVNSGILTRYCSAGMRDRERKNLAGGILSSLASCQFCSTAHLSTVMSNRSVPGGQISTLSLSKWQFESQSSLKPSLCLTANRYLKTQALRIEAANLNAPACNLEKGPNYCSEVTLRLMTFPFIKQTI